MADSVEVEVEKCGSWTARARGLIGRPPPAPGHGILIAPCRQVHTCFMAYAIDVIHLGSAHEVIGVQRLGPWRLGKLHWASDAVLELADGEASRLGIEPGVVLSLREAP